MNQNLSKFDIDLKYGEIYEEKLKDIFAGKIEVKAERDLWKKTGNIAIEIMNNGKYSGITTTKADWWIHLLTDKDSIVMGFLFPVSKLKRLIKETVKKDKAIIVKGGDNNESTLVLFKIECMHTFALRMEE